MLLFVDLNPITWLARFFGIIMDLIFRGVSAIGIPNIGLCIIIFTIVTKMLLYPLTLKQSKSQKLQSVLQPEISAIQAKYKGKENDQQAMMMQQAEIKAVYEKYGTSMASGCLPLLIQFPIIFGLYRVIINIPEYVPSVKAVFMKIVDAIGGEAAIPAFNAFIANNELTNLLSQARISGKEVTTVGEIVNVLNKLSADQWAAFKNAFSQAAAVIDQVLPQITQMNNFLGLDLAATPMSYGLTNWKAWIIPILAGLSQYVATKIMSAQNQPPKSAVPTEQDDTQKTTQGVMNTMNYMMPIMSVVFCFSFASGIGVYWIAQSVVSTIQQLFINKKMEKMDVNALIEKNLEKTNAKRAKKGLPPVSAKSAEDNYKKMQQKMSKLQAKRDEAVAKTNALREEANSYYKTSSIADRARMVQQYNEKNNKKK